MFAGIRLKRKLKASWASDRTNHSDGTADGFSRDTAKKATSAGWNPAKMEDKNGQAKVKCLTDHGQQIKLLKI